jgi:hypothetical protein
LEEEGGDGVSHFCCCCVYYEMRPTAASLLCGVDLRRLVAHFYLIRRPSDVSADRQELLEFVLLWILYQLDHSIRRSPAKDDSRKIFSLTTTASN